MPILYVNFNIKLLFLIQRECACLSWHSLSFAGYQTGSFFHCDLQLLLQDSTFGCKCPTSTDPCVPDCMEPLCGTLFDNTVRHANLKVAREVLWGEERDILHFIIAVQCHCCDRPLYEGTHHCTLLQASILCGKHIIHLGHCEDLARLSGFTECPLKAWPGWGG